MIRLLAINHARAVARTGGLRVHAAISIVAFGACAIALQPPPFVNTTASADTTVFTVAKWLWIALTPWWVARMTSVERGDAQVMLTAQAAADPAAAIGAQVAAAVLYACELAMWLAPLALLAFVTGRAQLGDVGVVALEVALAAAAAIVITLHCTMRAEHRLLSWIVATGLTATLMVAHVWASARVGAGVPAVVLLLLILAAGLLLPVRARRELLYLKT